MHGWLLKRRQRNFNGLDFKSLDEQVRQDIQLIGCLTEDELFNGSSAVRARKMIHVQSLCEAAGLDITISTEDAGKAYVRCIERYMNEPGYKWDSFKADAANVHKKRMWCHGA